MKIFMGQKAFNEVSKTSLHLNKIKIFSLNGQYLYITKVTRSLYSFEIRPKLENFVAVFLNTDFF